MTHAREFRGYGGKTWSELDLAGHQRWPGDFEAQGGQGAITLGMPRKVLI